MTTSKRPLLKLAEDIEDYARHLDGRDREIHILHAEVLRAADELILFASDLRHDDQVCDCYLCEICRNYDRAVEAWEKSNEPQG